MHLEQLIQLKQWAKDPVFQRSIVKVKQENKLRLTQMLEKDYGVQVNPASIFDIQVAYFFSSRENSFAVLHKVLIVYCVNR